METNKIGFLLSKEFEELPYYELYSLLDKNNKIEKVINNFVVVSNINTNKGVEIINRGGYINECYNLLFKVNNLNELYDKLNNYCFSEYDNNKNNSNNKNNNFAVRVLKIVDSSIKSMDIEKHIGGIIKNKTNLSVNLKAPNTTFKVIILNNEIYFSVLLNSRDREYYLKNRPHLRAYFHPGCILPKLARCMVNISKVNKGDILFDPFCGTGGFLIEGGLIGCKLVGSDIDINMVNGSKLNLESYNLNKNIISIKQYNALKCREYLNELNIDFVDGIVTDPPYGISTTKKGDIEYILNNLKSCLKENGYLVFASPTKLKLDDLILEKLYPIYVHKSLTRYIHVFKNSKR